MKNQVKILKDEVKKLSMQIDMLETINIPESDIFNMSSAINQCIILKNTFDTIIKEYESKGS